MEVKPNVTYELYRQAIRIIIVLVFLGCKVLMSNLITHGGMGGSSWEVCNDDNASFTLFVRPKGLYVYYTQYTYSS